MPCDHPPAIIQIANDRGGELGPYLARAGLYRACGDHLRVAGACNSACTIYLSLGPSRVCAQAGASFGFHQAYWPGRQGAPPDVAVHEATHAMWDAYPARLRAALGGRLTPGMRRLSGEQMVRLGVVARCGR